MKTNAWISIWDKIIFHKVDIIKQKKASVAQWVGCRPRKVKGQQFDSQSGRMPGLGVQSLAGAHAGGTWVMLLSHIDVSLPLWLPPFPSLQKKEKKLINF